MAVHIIACKVFEPELEEVLEQIQEENVFEPEVEIKTTYLAAGLHGFLSRMQEVIIESLEEHRNDSIVLLYGSACHPKIKEFTKGYVIVTFEERNCIQLIMPEQSEKQSRDFFLTTGWFVCEDFFGTNSYATREGMGLYDQMLFGNTHVCKITDEQMLNVFERTGVPIETVDVPLGLFKEKVLGAITEVSAKEAKKQ